MPPRFPIPGEDTTKLGSLGSMPTELEAQMDPRATDLNAVQAERAAPLDKASEGPKSACGQAVMQGALQHNRVCLAPHRRNQT
jgi:hypothetical protein